MTPPETPKNEDAERSLLACCFLENGREIVDDCVAAGLKGDDFYNPRHQIIFDGLCTLARNGINPEEILLAHHFQSTGKLELMGGHPYLLEITGGKVQTTVQSKRWMDVVLDKSMRRQVLRTAQWAADRVTGTSHSDREEMREVLGEIEAAFLRIGGDVAENNGQFLRDIMPGVKAQMQALMDGKREALGLRTGFHYLDQVIGGLRPGNMIVIGARPFLGKTVLALNIAEYLAALPPLDKPRDPVTTLFFSLEMQKDELLKRLICSRARVASTKIECGDVNYADRGAVAKAQTAMEGAQIIIDDSAGLNIYELRARARRHQRKSNIGVIMVDYLGNIVPSSRAASKEQEIAEVSTGLKLLAKELGVPVIAIAQLNRESEKDKRPPRLSDLRSSGQIEADADVVLLLAKQQNTEDAIEADVTTRQVIIAKNRHGQIGEITLTFHRSETRFETFNPQRQY